VLGEQAPSIQQLAHSWRNSATLEVWRVPSAHKRAVVKVVSADPLESLVKSSTTCTCAADERPRPDPRVLGLTRFDGHPRSGV
jgi:hypothetical protein